MSITDGFTGSEFHDDDVPHVETADDREQLLAYFKKKYPDLDESMMGTFLLGLDYELKKKEIVGPDDNVLDDATNQQIADLNRYAGAFKQGFEYVARVAKEHDLVSDDYKGPVNLRSFVAFFIGEDITIDVQNIIKQQQRLHVVAEAKKADNLKASSRSFGRRILDHVWNRKH